MPTAAVESTRPVISTGVLGSGHETARRAWEGSQEDVADGQDGIRYDSGGADVETLAAAALDLQTVWDSAIADLGATVPPTQLRALLIIDRFGRLSLNALAEQMRASTSSASKLCDRLQQAGLITRARTPADRRGVVLGLSDAGQRLVRWAQARHRDRLRSVIAAMSPHGRDALVRGLSEFRLVLRRTT
jgi:DNA-binding MarR family transcriptional regulator